MQLKIKQEESLSDWFIMHHSGLLLFEQTIALANFATSKFFSPIFLSLLADQSFLFPTLFYYI